MFCFVPEFVGQNRNDLLAIRKISDQIKMFCFWFDNNQTKSKPFASNYQLLDQIETFYFASDNLQTKSNCFASSQNIWAKIETICLQ
jgi:hypothetical protein